MAEGVAASVGLDADQLEAIAHTAEVGKSNCLVVARDGKLAFERYFHGTNADTSQEIFSATKSFTSTLVGLAVDAGKAHLADRVSTWIPEWRDTASAAVTVRDLLSNDSGRSWSIVQDYVQLIRAADQTAFSIGLTQTSAPGTVWAYNPRRSRRSNGWWRARSAPTSPPPRTTACSRRSAWTTPR